LIPAFLRDVRVMRIIGQVVFLALVAAGLGWHYHNLQTNLQAIGMKIGFGFLNNTAGFPISEGIKYAPTDTNGYAFLVGVVNTLRVVLVGIVFATLVGTIIGISRLSSNWLLRKLAGLYVETIRNIPLLVQLFFWYFAVFLSAFPLVKNSIALPGFIYLNKRGLHLPWLVPTAPFQRWEGFLIAGEIVASASYLFRSMQLKRAGRPGFPFGWALASFTVIATLGWFLSSAAPLRWDIPLQGRYNFSGGLELSASFFALFIGLVSYTAAFIAEIVRAGIQSVDKGQTEAAKAAGFSSGMILRLIILPQALRVIIPPLTSQYLNLTKNSSLAIMIGYYDLVNIGETIFNQTGRVVEVILMVMGSYLIMSLITSLFMNYYNRRIRLVEH